MSNVGIEFNEFVELWPGSASPEISILMPVYLNQRYIHGAVTSVLAQRGVVAEIIISDDCSGDGTFEVALQTVQDWLATHGSPHRIIVRRGRERLWRDHLALMAEHASCDIVCQAHGDDESHPNRAVAIAAVFQALPNVTLLASEFIPMDEAGISTVDEWSIASDIAYARYDFEAIIGGHIFLVGATQAWRRSAVSGFKRLDRDFAAVSHDRILSFRAALVGDVYLVKAQLIKRRDHPLAAHKLMFDEPDTDGRFGWSLAWMTHLDAMSRDLEYAKQSGMVKDGLYLPLANNIRQRSVECTQGLIEAYRTQMLTGRQIAWVDDVTLLALRKSRTG